MKRKQKEFGPLFFTCGPTRWNEKTIGFGGGKAYDAIREKWCWFICVNLWAVYVNAGITARAGKEPTGGKEET